ncbi:MAG TPA: AMP-binding protein [Dongiaceae bacterium]|nr:AMP-binding protein [Dongiaceae bacterium]
MSAVLAALARHAAGRPDAVAMIGDGVLLNYAALAARVDTVAATLFPVPGMRCALLLDNGIGWALTDLAARRARAVLVPIPLFFSPQQLRHALATSGVDGIVTDQTARLDQTLPAPQDVTALLGQPAAFVRLEQANHPRLPGVTDKVTFTSGTTGNPKGVCLSQDSIDRVAQSLLAASGGHAEDRHLALLPLATLLENIAAIDVPILAGATTVLWPLAAVGLKGSSQLDASAMLAAIERAEATSIVTVPQILMGLMGAVARSRPPARLRLVSVGGAPLSRMVLERAKAIGLPVCEGYGLSEASSVVAFNTPGDARPGSVGRPLPHVELTFAQDGEILVKGSIAQGYLGADPGTSQPRPDAFWPTGDLGHLDADGHLHLDGRKKDMFITSFGRNVAPEWVEAELTASGSIAQAAVFGEARPWNAAIIVPSGIGDPIADIGKVNDSLPDYARITRWLIAGEPFTAMNELATPNGRLRRDRIFARYREALQRIYEDETIDVL